MASEETLFVAQNSALLEKEHSGEYIAVVGSKVVASGKSIQEVYEAVDKKRIKEPLVTYVPKEGEEILLVCMSFPT